MRLHFIYGGKCMNNKNENPVQSYKDFMWNEQNEFNCSECPENLSGKYRGCGQQHCWVAVHQKSREESNECE